VKIIGTKVIEWTLAVYHYIVLALYFWVGILRGLVLYGVTPACVSLFLTYQGMRNHEEVDEKYIKQQFFKHYRDYDHYKVLSFLMSIGLLLLTALFTLSLSRGLSLVIVVVIIYFLLLLIGAASFTFYGLTIHKKAGRIAFAEGFVDMIKQIKVTVPLLVAVVIMLGVLYYNAILFLVMFPAGYAAVVTGLLSKSSQS
jgi:uncharacterized membrane protein YesL